MREETYESEKCYDVFGWFYFFSIDINTIAKGLECIETDANRKGKAQQRYFCAENTIEYGNSKIRILKVGKKAQNNHRGHNGDPKAQRFFLNLPDNQAGDIAYRNRNQNIGKIFRLTPCIEEKAEQKQNQISTLLWHKKITDSLPRNDQG